MKERQMHSNRHYFKSCGPDIYANAVIFFLHRAQNLRVLVI